ncbi:type II secretion system protein GspM [Glaciimonas sp. GG7]
MMHPFPKIHAMASSFWSQRNQRERRMLSCAAAFIVMVLIYLVLIDPALKGRARLQKELPTLRSQAALLELLTIKAAAVASVSTPSATPAAWPFTKAGIEASLKSKALRVQSVEQSGDTATMAFSAVPFAVLFDWLTEVQKSAHWQVGIANISTGSGQPDSVNASITLRQTS